MRYESSDAGVFSKGIFWMLRFGAPWRDEPAVFGPSRGTPRGLFGSIGLVADYS